MRNLKFIYFLLLTFQFSFGQTKESIPESFTKIEGLEFVGNITFYFQEKTQTILAYQNEKIKWKSKVIKVCGKPAVGKSKIRQISIAENGLKVVYGKHNFAKIVMETGEIICEGSD